MHKCQKSSCPNPRTCKCRTIREAAFPIIWMVGGTGSGKMTLGNLLAAHFGMDYISTGELLRDEIQHKKHPSYKTIEKNVADGVLVDDTIVVEIVERRLRRLLKKSKGFIVSFAKNIQQSDLFEKFIAPVDLILYLECKDETMMERSIGRMREMSDGGGGANEDDVQEIIERRIQTFREYIGDIQKQYGAKMETLPAEVPPYELLDVAIPLVEAVTTKKMAETPEPKCGPEEGIAEDGEADMNNALLETAEPTNDDAEQGAAGKQ